MAMNTNEDRNEFRKRPVRRRKKLCPFSAKQQRIVTQAIKRARHLALMPYIAE